MIRWQIEDDDSIIHALYLPLDKQSNSSTYEPDKLFRPDEPAPNMNASNDYASAEQCKQHNDMREENLTDFIDKTVQDPVHVIDDNDEALAANNPQAELLWWHYQLGHIPFARLCILALLGIIPRQLIHIQSPKCAGCLYGAMTKRPWRTRAQQNKAISRL